MQEFLFEGFDNMGDVVKDSIEAKDEKQALTLLRKRKIKVTKIKEDAKPLLARKKVKSTELMQVTKKMSSMVKAGLPVVETISILKGQAKSYGMKYVLSSVYRDLNTGSTISEAFGRHPKVFDNIYLNIISAGEESGALDEFLGKLAVMMEKRDKIAKGLKKAFTYPIIVMVIALGISTFMLIKVIPIFQEMYGGMGVDLPSFTKALIAVSEFLRDPSKGGLTFISVIAFFFLFNFALKSSLKLRKTWHKITLKLPLFGNLIRKSILARVSLVMGNLNQAGVDILESLDIAKSVTTNTIVIEAIENIKKGVFSGESLTVLFSKEKIFPPTFSQLISVGEQTGSLDSMFASVAKYYEEEFDTAVDNMSSLIEPIMIVFMGSMIGGLMIAMYSPIFNVGAIIGQ